ncbi:MAG: PAS domain S-box protein [Aquabacterium sp.]|nr:MAG: PAS domain S-box protein [Aquabacterium sp.]
MSPTVLAGYVIALCVVGFVPALVRPSFATVGLAAVCAAVGLATLWRASGRMRSADASRIAELEREAARQCADRSALMEARDAAVAELQAAEERYLSALRGSQDGLWEWDIASDRVELSPRWKSMLGRETGGTGSSPRAEWLSCVHPDDRAALEAALQAHLASGETRFDHEMRLLHQDGRVRWVLSRGTAIRRASGAPYRMVGLDTDVTRLKRMETVLDAVAHGTSGAFGERFFETLVQHFARALEVSMAFVTECADQPATRLRTLAVWADDGHQDNFEYGLSGTPCEEVIQGGRICFHPEGIGRLYPAEAGFEGYLGLPIVSSAGQVLGHLAFLHRQPLGDEVLVDSIYRIFLSRAAAEIERIRVLTQLERAAPGPDL